MAPPSLANECEHSYTSKKPLKKTKKKFHSAVTIKLNTAPWKRNGIVNEETVYQIIHSIFQSQNEPNPTFTNHVAQDLSIILLPVKWELDSKCQLHLHTTIETSKPIYRKRTLKFIKDNVKNSKNYSTYIKPISHDELDYWLRYLAKTKIDVRPLYYRIITYYHAQPQVIEDFSDIADYDVEYNSKTSHFEYIDSSKVKAWETKY